MTILLKYEDGTIILAKAMAIIIEPRHDKTNKVTVRPAKTQLSPASRVLAVGMKKPWALSCPLSGSAQSDQSLRCALSG